MPTNDGIRQNIKDFDFKALFIEDLNWDRFRATPPRITIDGTSYTLTPVAEKRGFQVFECSPAPSGQIPDRAIRMKIERQISKLAVEHLVVFVDADKTTQTWQWVRRELGKPLAVRTETYSRGHTGERLAQKLDALRISFEEEENLFITEVADRARRGFDVDRITKRFYDLFKKEHEAFLKFVQGIQDKADKEWYASLMLNRLMFIYFVQKKGFLDGDRNYLRNRLRKLQESHGRDRFHSFYRYFLLRLFHEGLGSQVRTPDLDRLLGRVPYLNGGLFDVHELERQNPNIQIADDAFEKIFNFFDEYQWHLDDHPLRSDHEINPDVLGYIFEKYINQKQMGAYYTKEDITEYIGKSTILPFLFETAKKQCAIAFREDGALWSLLRENPDRYIYDAVKHGVMVDAIESPTRMLLKSLELPKEIAKGQMNISERGSWNKPAPAAFALPTEIWREVVARRKRYEEVRKKLVDGSVHSINDLITYNLDIRQFAQDVIDNCEGPELLRAFYKAIEKVTILDPTCGSGAFLFAALNVLEPIYEACLNRMQTFLDELDGSGEKYPREKFSDFRTILNQVRLHPSRRYFILKSIVISNLYGVDVMEEATEICKLRLFLKLVAQLERPEQIEPLPDIDFNIRSGNTLVGFATYEDVQQTLMARQGQGRLIYDDSLMREIDEKAEMAAQAFEKFHAIQIEHDMDAEQVHAAKDNLRTRLKTLCEELDKYLGGEYGILVKDGAGLNRWRESHEPFHWFIEFYGIMKNGGFDVIIGNPPYVEYSKVKDEYKVKGYKTESCGNLYAFTFERSLKILHKDGTLGFIIPVSFSSSGAIKPLRDVVWDQSRLLWLSHFANRPGQLFEGAQNRLTIVICGSRQESKEVFSTRYHRWDGRRGARDTLFATIEYTLLGNLARHFHGLFPKVGSKEAISYLNKIEARHTLREHLSKSTPNRVYWVRVPGYFCQFFLSPPKAKPETGGPERIRGEVNSISAADKKVQKALHAILNSSTYYQFFCVYTDGRHINPSDVLDFPLDVKTFSSNTIGSLYQHSTELELCMTSNITKWRKSGLIIDSVDSKPCKPQIDEIDRVLAQHYNFTEEELDFIINYDIKFRIGADESADDESL